MAASLTMSTFTLCPSSLRWPTCLVRIVREFIRFMTIILIGPFVFKHFQSTGNIISAYAVDRIGRSRTLALSMLVSALSVFFIFTVKSAEGTTVSHSFNPSFVFN